MATDGNVEDEKGVFVIMTVDVVVFTAITGGDIDLL